MTGEALGLILSDLNSIDNSIKITLRPAYYLSSTLACLGVWILPAHRRASYTFDPHLTSSGGRQVTWILDVSFPKPSTLVTLSKQHHLNYWKPSAKLTSSVGRHTKAFARITSLSVPSVNI